MSALERAFAEVEGRFGTVRDYLLANGLSEGALERLHARVVEAD